MGRSTKREVRRQREVIRDVMLSAGLCAAWLTLEELARLTHYPPASISAQLRHLRKPRFGAYAVVKRSRRVNPGMRGDGFGTLWEYSVGQAVPEQRQHRLRKKLVRRRRNLRPRRAQKRPQATKAFAAKS